MKKMKCHLCNNLLDKDLIALNKKLLNRHIGKFFCIDCLSEYLCCTKDDLITKIEEFKEQGCSLFR